MTQIIIHSYTQMNYDQIAKFLSGKKIFNFEYINHEVVYKLFRGLEQKFFEYTIYTTDPVDVEVYSFLTTTQTTFVNSVKDMP